MLATEFDIRSYNEYKNPDIRTIPNQANTSSLCINDVWKQKGKVSESIR